MNDRGTVTAFYTRWAALYDAVATHTPGIIRIRRQTVGALALTGGETVVEMGCGTGANLPYLREAVGGRGQVVGIDLTPGMLDRAARRARQNDWRNVSIVKGDAAQPPVAEASGILATFVIGMLDDPRAAIDQWCDRLRPGERIVLLDASSSRHVIGSVLNPVFRAFVRVTTPPTTRLSYAEPPATRLDARVQAARDALSARARIVRDDQLAGGYLRLTAAEVT